MKVLEETKNRIVFTLDEDHAYCNLLKTALTKDDNVKLATYAQVHPLVDKPKFIVEANDVRKALEQASKEISKDLEQIEKLVEKEL